MSERYHVGDKHDIPSTLDSAIQAKTLAKDGQLLLPMLDLIENGHSALRDRVRRVKNW